MFSCCLAVKSVSSCRTGGGRVARSASHARPPVSEDGPEQSNRPPSRKSHLSVPNDQDGARLGGGDSTDASGEWKISTSGAVIPGTLLTGFGDSADATRGYPEDSTDESNN